MKKIDFAGEGDFDESGAGVVAAVDRMPPVDTNYRFGRWHKDRLTWRGVWIETKVLGRSLVTERNQSVRKFLIVGRARSGTTLLRKLLNSHPDVTCEGEVLKQSVLGPTSHLERLASKSRGAAWGAKLLSYQMVQVHRFRDPAGFLAGLHERGFLLIHLTRNTFDQTLSLEHAGRVGRFRPGRVTPRNTTFALDPSDFLKKLRWNDALLRYEQHCLSALPHLTVSYEHGLRSKADHATTSATLFEKLGVPPVPVEALFEKTIQTPPDEIIANFGEISDAMHSAGLSHLFEDAERAWKAD